MSANDLPVWARRLPRAPRVALLLAGGFHADHRPDAAVLERLGSNMADVSALAEALRGPSLPEGDLAGTSGLGDEDRAPLIVRVRGRLHRYDNIHQIGGHELAWRSHRHAWHALSCDLTTDDVIRLKAVALDLLPQPRLESSPLDDVVNRPSPRLMDGLAESLALLGSSDDRVDPLALVWEGQARSASAWADAIVQALLEGGLNVGQHWLPGCHY